MNSAESRASSEQLQEKTHEVQSGKGFTKINDVAKRKTALP